MSRVAACQSPLEDEPGGGFLTAVEIGGATTADSNVTAAPDAAANRALRTQINARCGDDHAYRAWTADDITWGVFTDLVRRAPEEHPVPLQCLGRVTDASPRCRSVPVSSADVQAVHPDPANEPPTDDQEGLTAFWRSGL